MHSAMSAASGAPVAERRHPGQEPRLEEGVLDHLAQAGAELPLRQGAQGPGIGQHRRGRVEGPDRVLGHRQVDGRLAAQRRVDHGEERGRHRHPGDAAHEGGGQEAGRVGHRAAAHRHHQAPAGEAGLEQPAGGPLQLGQRLARLAVGQHVDPRHPARPGAPPPAPGARPASATPAGRSPPPGRRAPWRARAAAPARRVRPAPRSGARPGGPGASAWRVRRYGSSWP